MQPRTCRARCRSCSANRWVVRSWRSSGFTLHPWAWKDSLVWKNKYGTLSRTETNWQAISISALQCAMEANCHSALIFQSGIGQKCMKKHNERFWRVYRWETRFSPALAEPPWLQSREKDCNSSFQFFESFWNINHLVDTFQWTRADWQSNYFLFFLFETKSYIVSVILKTDSNHSHWSSGQRIGTQKYEDKCVFRTTILCQTLSQKAGNDIFIWIEVLIDFIPSWFNRNLRPMPVPLVVLVLTLDDNNRCNCPTQVVAYMLDTVTRGWWEMEHEKWIIARKKHPLGDFLMDHSLLWSVQELHMVYDV
jgi:hypothetical protein